jgi:hypothetical protein
LAALAAPLAVLALAGISGCGGGDDATANVVVEVKGNVITQGMVAHWLSVSANRNYELIPRGPVPKGALPDPPDYVACIAYLEKVAKKPVTGAGDPAGSVFKAQCRQQYALLRQQVLGSLITSMWLIGEAQQRGLSASKGEIQRFFQTVRNQEFPDQAKFAKYLALTDETLSDRMFRAKVKVLSKKIEAQVKAEGQRQGHSTDQALSDYLQAFAKRWVPSTRCDPGYVVADCSEYRGSSAPEVMIL